MKTDNQQPVTVAEGKSEATLAAPSGSARFHVLKFPSYQGTPWKFRWRWMAMAAAYIRMFSGINEVRVIDRKTGEHIAVM